MNDYQRDMTGSIDIKAKAKCVELCSKTIVWNIYITHILQATKMTGQKCMFRICCTINQAL